MKLEGREWSAEATLNQAVQGSIPELCSIAHLGGGCGSVGRAVTRDLRFESSQWQNFYQLNYLPIV